MFVRKIMAVVAFHPGIEESMLLRLVPLLNPQVRLHTYLSLPALRSGATTVEVDLSQHYFPPPPSITRCIAISAGPSAKRSHIVVVGFASPSYRSPATSSSEDSSLPSFASDRTLFLASPLSVPSTNGSKLTPFAADGNATTETGGGGGGGASGGSSGGGGGGGGGGGDGSSNGGDSDSEKNRADALAALAALGRTVQSLPADLAEAIMAGKIPGIIVERFAALEKSPLLKHLLRFDGFKERLLADDLFMTKVAIECGVGLFTKTGAEYEKRRENFLKELDFVVADVIMALVADFMLVWLPAPTVALRAPLAGNASRLALFFANCPDNAFQVALRGTSYSLLQRVGAIVRNGAKLLGVGTVASLFGCGMTNALILARKSMAKQGAADGSGAEASAQQHEGEETKVPILATSVAYGVYMAVSSNLRYQILAGIVEQRMLEPMLHNQKLLLSVLSFIVRTGNTFLGSLLWVDYARISRDLYRSFLRHSAPPKAPLPPSILSANPSPRPFLPEVPRVPSARASATANPFPFQRAAFAASRGKPPRESGRVGRIRRGRGRRNEGGKGGARGDRVGGFAPSASASTAQLSLFRSSPLPFSPRLAPATLPRPVSNRAPLPRCMRSSAMAPECPFPTARRACVHVCVSPLPRRTPLPPAPLPRASPPPAPPHLPTRASPSPLLPQVHVFFRHGARVPLPHSKARVLENRAGGKGGNGETKKKGERKGQVEGKEKGNENGSRGGSEEIEEGKEQGPAKQQGLGEGQRGGRGEGNKEEGSEEQGREWEGFPGVEVWESRAVRAVDMAGLPERSHTRGVEGWPFGQLTHTGWWAGGCICESTQKEVWESRAVRAIDMTGLPERSHTRGVEGWPFGQLTRIGAREAEELGRRLWEVYGAALQVYSKGRGVVGIVDSRASHQLSTDLPLRRQQQQHVGQWRSAQTTTRRSLTRGDARGERACTTQLTHSAWRRVTQGLPPLPLPSPAPSHSSAANVPAAAASEADGGVTYGAAAAAAAAAGVAAALDGITPTAATSAVNGAGASTGVGVAGATAAVTAADGDSDAGSGGGWRKKHVSAREAMRAILGLPSGPFPWPWAVDFLHCCHHHGDRLPPHITPAIVHSIRALIAQDYATLYSVSLFLKASS
ncbi:unnamed protein product [Closterium sp. Yama58-4]|nr:unnamed protein product [Closterium sp. Yama58-4]